jgi:hypothetical protein
MNLAPGTYVIILLMKLTGWAIGTSFTGLLLSRSEGRRVVGGEEAGRDAGGTMGWRGRGRQGCRRYDGLLGKRPAGMPAVRWIGGEEAGRGAGGTNLKYKDGK